MISCNFKFILKRISAIFYNTIKSAQKIIGTSGCNLIKNKLNCAKNVRCLFKWKSLKVTTLAPSGEIGYFRMTARTTPIVFCRFSLIRKIWPISKMIPTGDLCPSVIMWRQNNVTSDNVTSYCDAWTEIPSRDHFRYNNVVCKNTKYHGSKADSFENTPISKIWITIIYVQKITAILLVMNHLTVLSP